MRIRVQLLIAITLAFVLGGGAVSLTVRAARQESLASDTMARAQTASHEVSGLLVLTQEYARYGEPRAAQQWRHRHAVIDTTLRGDGLVGPAVRELKAVTHALPELFMRLEEMPEANDTFSHRRREVLLDQLLTSTQAMSDLAYQWYQETADRRAIAERRFQLMAVASPLAMMLMLIALALLLRSRVLGPLAAISTATQALSRGDLTVRVNRSGSDEFAELSQHFDEMAAVLSASRERVQRSEHQLKSVTDNLQMFIAYAGPDQRLQFANAHHERVLKRPQKALLGLTLEQVLGADHHAQTEAAFARALAGERQRFEVEGRDPGLPKHMLTEFIPDVAGDGTVAGVFVMNLDITPLKEAQMAHARREHQLRVITDNVPALITHVDLNERYTFANAPVARFTRRKPEEIVGHTLQEVRGVDYAKVAHHVKAALAGEARTYEDSLVTSRGEILYQATLIPDLDEQGRVVGFYSMTFDVTERKQAELVQAQSEARVRSILTHAPDAFISIDARSCIREWNRQAELTFGWTRDEVLGRSLADTIIPSGQRAGHLAGMREFVTTGRGPVLNQRIETHAVHKDGHEIPIELSIAAVSDGSGHAANAFLRDITARRAAEAELRASEQRLRQLTDSIPAMVGYFDTEERCLFANSTVLKAHGFDAADIPRHTLRSGLGEDSYALHEPHVKVALQGRRASFEGHLVRRGRDVHFQAHLVPDLGADGVVRGFYVMTFDITPVRRAELERARSEKLLRQITDNLPVLISYVDRDLRVQFANGTYRTWLGVDPQRLIGMHVKDAVGEELYAPRAAYVEQALAGERVEFENTATALGVQRDTQVTYIPDVDEGGTVRGIYTLTADVSDLKRVERRLQALARYDALTGLPNRLLFNEKLAEALARSERSGSALALMFLDVDHFKSINDSLGHAAGDAVLQAFGAGLVASVRTTDTVARLAGDEFVIILEGLHEQGEISRIADKIVRQASEPIVFERSRIQITTSVGVAYHEPAHGHMTPEALLSEADDALYLAKEAGRNTFRVTRTSALPRSLS